MKTVCKTNECTGCMACIEVCSNNAIEIKDDLTAYNAIIKEDCCTNCGACFRVCQNCTDSIFTEPIEWFQGWSNNEKTRAQSSSGGVAAAIEKSFIMSGGLVYSCLFKNGEFVFDVADKPDYVDKFIGSKYVKSNPRGVYKSIKEQLENGNKVLFLGLPCQVSALKKFIGIKYNNQLYTVDLICHGTPSPQILDIFLRQYKYSLKSINNIHFRTKTKFQVYVDYKPISTSSVCDYYSMAFLNSICYTENCYHCSYAKRQRISDLTLGDSWGSTIDDEEMKKGISLILCQNDKGMELLKQVNLNLQAVDIQKAIEANHQLSTPSIKPKKINYFFKSIKDGKSFNSVVFRCYPLAILKQKFKSILKGMKVYNG